MTPGIVLYNPRTSGAEPPLALLHLLRAVDVAGWTGQIADGRLKPLRSPADLPSLDGARVFAVTLLTGPGLLDALAAVALARVRWPEVLVVAGGWHPSLAPDEVLAAGIDVCIRGQGERPLQQLLETIAPVRGREEAIATLRAAAIPGLALPGAHSAPAGIAGVDGFADWPPVDYGRVPLREYWAAASAARRTQGHPAARRWVPYLASIGCPYSCSFCSDPSVFGRRFAALDAPRIAADVRALSQAHGIGEVQFVDETFFVSRPRALAWAEANLASPSPVAWSATARAEQVAALDGTALELLARSGCEKLLVGAESGASSELARIGKGYDGAQVLEAARRLTAAGIRGEFGFILGLPGQTEDEERETVRTIAEIARIAPSFRLPVFLFTPFPGTPATAAWQAAGGEIPVRLEDWAAWDFAASRRWSGPGDPERLRRIQFYSRFLQQPPGREGRGLLRRAARAFAQRRFRRGDFGFPWERVVWRALRRGSGA